jgi:hypothetical protein
MVEIQQCFRDWPRLNFFVVKVSENSKNQKLIASSQDAVYACQSQLLKQLAGFPVTSCKIIPLVDRLTFLISNHQQSNMTAERSGEAELTLLPLLYGPEQQSTATDVGSLCSCCQRSIFG